MCTYKDPLTSLVECYQILDDFLAFHNKVLNAQGGIKIYYSYVMIIVVRFIMCCAYFTHLNIKSAEECVQRLL